MRNFISKFMVRFYKKKQLTSLALRKHFIDKYNIEIGLYSYGCFCPERIASGTRIGRYCSIAESVHILNGNHGLHFLTLHPYTYNTNLGIVSKETITRTQCIISDDVWIGHNAIILPNVSLIGRGAVIAAGAVVTKNVDAYSIVGGNPAKIIRMRFDNTVVEQIEATRWWEWDKEKLAEQIKHFPELIYSPETFFNKI